MIGKRLGERQKHHPQPGDVCVGCVHEPSPHGAQYYLVTKGMQFTRPDGVSSIAKWILLCDACFIEHGHDIDGELRKNRIKIACDLLWPEKLEVEFIDS